MQGIWMWADSLLEPGADRVFDDCALIGTTDVFFLTKGLSGRCAFPSRMAPHAAGGRDLMTEAANAAHARGMRLHAWFTSAQDESYCRAHPESAAFHLKKGASDKVVRISDERYAAYLRALIAETLSFCPVDGVHLDYIRYNHLLYGWSDADIKRYGQYGVDAGRARQLVERTFTEEKGSAPDIFELYRLGDETARALAQARIKDVCRFAYAVLDGVREAHSGICVSAAFMPEGAYDAAFAHLHYGQSYADLCPRLDLILPMAYSAAYEKDSAWVKAVVQGTAEYGKPVLAGLHAFDGGTGATLFSDAKAAESVPGAEGICLFRYGASLLAASDGQTLTLVNPMPVPVTRIELSDGKQAQAYEMAVAPGERLSLPLPFAVALLRAWSGETEVCAFLAKQPQRFAV